jgi:hypothetical protein
MYIVLMMAIEEAEGAHDSSSRSVSAKRSSDVRDKS